MTGVKVLAEPRMGEDVQDDAGLRRLARLLAPLRGWLPASLAPTDVRAIPAPAASADLNEIVEHVSHSLGAGSDRSNGPITALLDPAIPAVLLSVPALRVLMATLVREAMEAAPASADITYACEVGTRSAGGAVHLSIVRARDGETPMVWRHASVIEALAAVLDTAVTLHADREAMSAQARFRGLGPPPVVGSALVLDDDPGVREVVCRILEQGGIPAAAATSASDFESRLAVSPGLVAVMEAACMEKPTGHVVEWLARRHPDWGARVVLLTTSPATELARRAFVALGRDWFLTKPFSSLDLVACLRRRLLCLAGRVPF